MADLPSAYPLRDLFDVAVRDQNVRLTCLGCGHACVASGIALWWLFHSRGWKDDFRSVARRCVCTMCWFRLGRKVRGPRFELVRGEPPTLVLPIPSELEWKRELRRRR